MVTGRVLEPIINGVAWQHNETLLERHTDDVDLSNVRTLLSNGPAGERIFTIFCKTKEKKRSRNKVS